MLHQVPAGSINESKSPSALPEPLFKYSSVTQYLIPTQQFCDRLLTFCVNHHRVIGYPVCIREGKYSRNEFIFNFAIVIGESEPDWACYGEVVRKLGRLLRGLEEQGGFLSREEVGVWDDEVKSGLGRADEEHSAFGVGGGSKVYALCEMVLEDLNNYAECMIPIGKAYMVASHSTLTEYRRLKHHQFEALPDTAASPTYSCASGAFVDDFPIQPPDTYIFRSYFEPRLAIYQWDQ